MLLALVFWFPVFAHAQNITDLAANFVSKATIESAGSLGNVVYSTAEGDFPTIMVSKSEELRFALTVPTALIGKIITIRADDGGIVKGGDEKNGDICRPLAG